MEVWTLSWTIVLFIDCSMVYLWILMSMTLLNGAAWQS